MENKRWEYRHLVASHQQLPGQPNCVLRVLLFPSQTLFSVAQLVTSPAITSLCDFSIRQFWEPTVYLKELRTASPIHKKMQDRVP